MQGQHWIMRCRMGYFDLKSFSSSTGFKTAAISNELQELEKRNINLFQYIISILERRSLLPDALLRPKYCSDSRGIVRITQVNNYTLICRSFRVGDKCDLRGTITFSHNYLLSDEERTLFFNQPEIILDRWNFDCYDEIASRSSLNEAKPVNVNQRLSLFNNVSPLSDNSILEQLGFTKDVFAKFIASLCDKVSGGGTVVLLTDGIGTDLWDSEGGSLLGEQFLAVLYRIMPKCITHYMGAVSFWNNDALHYSLEGIHLIIADEYSNALIKDSISLFSLSESNFQLRNISKYNELGVFIWENRNNPAMLKGFDGFIHELLGDKSNQFLKYSDTMDVLLDLYRFSEGMPRSKSDSSLLLWTISLFDNTLFWFKGQKLDKLCTSLIEIEMNQAHHSAKLIEQLCKIIRNEHSETLIFYPKAIWCVLQNIYRNEANQDTIGVIKKKYHESPSARVPIIEFLNQNVILYSEHKKYRQYHNLNVILQGKEYQNRQFEYAFKYRNWNECLNILDIIEFDTETYSRYIRLFFASDDFVCQKVTEYLSNQINELSTPNLERLGATILWKLFMNSMKNNLEQLLLDCSSVRSKNSFKLFYSILRLSNCDKTFDEWIEIYAQIVCHSRIDCDQLGEIIVLTPKFNQRLVIVKTTICEWTNAQIQELFYHDFSGYNYLIPLYCQTPFTDRSEIDCRVVEAVYSCLLSEEQWAELLYSKLSFLNPYEKRIFKIADLFYDIWFRKKSDIWNTCATKDFNQWIERVVNVLTEISAFENDLNTLNACYLKGDTFLLLFVQNCMEKKLTEYFSNTEVQIAWLLVPDELKGWSKKHYKKVLEDSNLLCSEESTYDLALLKLLAYCQPYVDSFQTLATELRQSSGEIEYADIILKKYGTYSKKIKELAAYVYQQHGENWCCYLIQLLLSYEAKELYLFFGIFCILLWKPECSNLNLFVSYAKKHEELLGDFFKSAPCYKEEIERVIDLLFRHIIPNFFLSDNSNLHWISDSSMIKDYYIIQEWRKKYNWDSSQELNERFKFCECCQNLTVSEYPYDIIRCFPRHIKPEWVNESENLKSNAVFMCKCLEAKIKSYREYTTVITEKNFSEIRQLSRLAVILISCPTIRSEQLLDEFFEAIEKCSQKSDDLVLKTCCVLFAYDFVNILDSKEILVNGNWNIFISALKAEICKWIKENYYRQVYSNKLVQKILERCYKREKNEELAKIIATCQENSSMSTGQLYVSKSISTTPKDLSKRNRGFSFLPRNH